MEQNEFIEAKRAKLELIKEKGIEPYGRYFKKDSDICKVLSDFKKGESIQTAGRLLTMRAHGKSIFADLKDMTGRIQLYFKSDVLGQERFELFSK